MSPITRPALMTAAALSVAVTAVHVDDQGGVTAFADPDWLGWAYRLLELGGLAVAGALVFVAGARLSSRLVWVAALAVGAGPFVGFVLTRTTGLPGATDDIGNWGEPLGVASLVIEGLLVLVAAAGLAAQRTNARSPRHPMPSREHREPAAA